MPGATFVVSLLLARNSRHEFGSWKCGEEKRPWVKMKEGSGSESRDGQGRSDIVYELKFANKNDQTRSNPFENQKTTPLLHQSLSTYVRIAILGYVHMCGLHIDNQDWFSSESSTQQLNMAS